MKEKYRRSTVTGRWLMKNLHGDFTIILPKGFSPAKFWKSQRK